MAISANILSQSNILIPQVFSFLSSRNTKITFKFPSSLLLDQTLHLHKRTSISTSTTKVASDMEIQETSSISNTPQWREFANNVSGEWDGYGADFTTKGKPIELPENVVPEAYREWEVRVFDWQTQCPTLAKPEESSLMYKLIQLLPTVGCEADAATQHSIDERNVGGADNKVSAFAYDTSGCYVAVWPLSDNGVSKLFEVEHCLVDPQNREARVRIVQVIRVDRTLLLQNIKVYREQWYGPFRNGDQLGGCSIRDTAFASTDATKGSEVTGSWHGSCVVARFQSHTDISQQLIDQKPQNLVRDDHGLIFLPKQLWCSLKEEENDDTCAEVGWLFKQGSAITSRCSFMKDGKLKEVAIGHETLQRYSHRSWWSSASIIYILFIVCML